MSLIRKTEIFYTTDSGFAIPSIASITSLRKWQAPKDLAINVLALGMSEEQIETFGSLSENLCINLHVINTERLLAFNNEKFHQTHVPYSTLARFLIPAVIRDDELLDILYIDGDTWFARDPRALIDIPAPQVGLLAAEDQSYFYMNDLGKTGRATSAYFKDISIDRTNGYFNAGILKSRASEWTRISAASLSFLDSNLSICRYHDQSALNAVAGKTRTRLSPLWNFQTSYWGWGVSDFADPKLLHFVGGAKPWMGPLRAWSSIYPEYSAIIRSLAHPLFPLKRWSEQEHQHFLKAEQRLTLKNKSIYFHRTLNRRARFKKLLETSLL